MRGVRMGSEHLRSVSFRRNAIVFGTSTQQKPAREARPHSREPPDHVKAVHHPNRTAAGPSARLRHAARRAGAGRTGRHLRHGRQVRQVLQRSRVRRRRALRVRDGRQLPRLRADQRGAARAGDAAPRQAWRGPDRGGRLQPGSGAGEGRQGVPGHALRDHRHGRRPAERAVDRVQGARGLVPGRGTRGDGLEDRRGRLRRRHGHSADPQASPAATRRAPSTSTPTPTSSRT